jgi:RNase P subunit RPR2
MAIKILFNPHQHIKTITCWNCDSILEYDFSDIRLNQPEDLLGEPPGTLETIKCQACQTALRIGFSSFVGDMADEMAGRERATGLSCCIV